jgi:hypothetical protein
MAVSKPAPIEIKDTTAAIPIKIPRIVNQDLKPRCLKFPKAKEK